MSSGSKTKEKSTTTGQSVVTPTYQAYATPIIQSLYPQMQQAYGQSMADYLQPTGYNPAQAGIWSAIGDQALQYGPSGPGGLAAEGAIAPYMGAGYMRALEPYYAGMRKEIQEAVPGETATFWQDMKRQMGPLWGRSGRAADQVAEAYGRLKLQQADRMAGLYGQQAQAAQQGIQYSGQVAPTYANLASPFGWGQQAVQWAGQPEAEIAAEQQAAQQMALPWSQQLAGLATLGYTYPQYTTEMGQQTTKGEGKTYGGGSQCCFMFIMGEGNIIDQVQRFKYDHFGYNSHVANGYRWMSLKLMPLIRKNRHVKTFIKYFITLPLSKVAIHHYNHDFRRWLYVPVGLLWCTIWSLIGRMAKYNSKPYQDMVKSLGI